MAGISKQRREKHADRNAVAKVAASQAAGSFPSDELSVRGDELSPETSGGSGEAMSVCSSKSYLCISRNTAVRAETLLLIHGRAVNRAK